MVPIRAPGPFYEVTSLSRPDLIVLNLPIRFAETRPRLLHDLAFHPEYPGSTSPCAIRNNRRTASFRETSQNLWIAMKEY